MEQPNYPQQFEEEIEIDIFECMETLWKNKWVVVGITLLAIVIAAMVTTFVLTETYEAEVIFPLPEDEGYGLSEEGYKSLALSDRVMVSLLDKGEHTENIEHPRNLRERLNVEIESGPGNMIFKTSAPSAEAASSLVEEWRNIFNEHAYQYVEEKISRELSRTEEDVQSLASSLGDVEHEAIVMMQDREEGEPGSLALQLAVSSAYGEQYVRAVRRKEQLEALLEDLKSLIYTEPLIGPTMPDSPISPRPRLNMVIAAFLGIMVGGFVVFVNQSWKERKRRKEETPHA